MNFDNLTLDRTDTIKSKEESSEVKKLREQIRIMNLEKNTQERKEISKKIISINKLIDYKIKNGNNTFGRMDDISKVKTSSKKISATDKFKNQVLVDTGMEGVSNLFSSDKIEENKNYTGGRTEYLVDKVYKNILSNFGEEKMIYSKNNNSEEIINFSKIALSKPKDQIKKLVDFLNEEAKKDSLEISSNNIAGLDFNVSKFEDLSSKLTFIKKFLSGLEIKLQNFEEGSFVNAIQYMELYTGLGIDAIGEYLEEISKDSNFESTVNFIVKGEFDKMIAKKFLGKPDEISSIEQMKNQKMSNEEVAELGVDVIIALIIKFQYRIPYIRRIPNPMFPQWARRRKNKIATKLEKEKGEKFQKIFNEIRDVAKKHKLELMEDIRDTSRIKEYNKAKKELNKLSKLYDKTNNTSKKEKIYKDIKNKLYDIGHKEEGFFKKIFKKILKK